MTRRANIAFRAIALTIPVDLVVSWAIGHAAAKAPATFDWNAAAAASTAAGTLLLALVTGVLAVLTYQEVQTTRALEADRHRPTLVIRSRRIDATDWRDPDAFGLLTLAIANVGVGPALNVRLSATHPDPSISTEEVILSDIAVDREPDVAKISYRIRSADPPPGEQRRRPQDPSADSFKISLECVDRTLVPVPDALVELQPNT